MKPVEISGLNYAIAGQLILENVSLQIEENEFVGLIGPNGGGKTTLLRIMLGLIRGWSGEIKIFGTNPLKLGNKRQLVAYVPQGNTSTIGFPATTLDVVLMGRIPTRGLFHSLTAEDRDVAAAMLTEVAMIHYRHRSFSDLSGGQRQRVLIARALATQPKLLLLDEPTTGIDQAAQASFYELLAKLKQQFGISLIMSSHDLSAVSQHCTNVACLNRLMYQHDSPKQLNHQTLYELFGPHLELCIHGDVPHRVLKTHEPTSQNNSATTSAPPKDT
ncbi:MAG: metal ABC transporter ATP-binding protein [Deltaproteobacteria bacterium]|nr:metal ABC transporter ATP-binding protein [Deltaproteobacteria bacterium]